MENLKKKVNDRAEELGISRKEAVSRFLKVDYSTYYRWCAGLCEPSPDAMCRIVDFLKDRRTDIPRDVMDWMTSLTRSSSSTTEIREEASELLNLSMSDCMCNKC